MDEVERARDPSMRFGFGHDLDAPRRARQAVKQMFRNRRDPLEADACLVVSELVSNVVLHTANGGEVRAYDPRPKGPVRVEVEDSERIAPAMLQPSARDTSGRGLQIVREVSRRWGTVGLASGKVVWAELG
jgi:anti-sigma regulatory factor (Ser/Thr protein kinase)